MALPPLFAASSEMLAKKPAMVVRASLAVLRSLSSAIFTLTCAAQEWFRLAGNAYLVRRLPHATFSANDIHRRSSMVKTGHYWYGAVSSLNSKPIFDWLYRLTLSPTVELSALLL